MSATCRTCGGADGHHKPSVLDPHGVSNAGHAMPLGRVNARPSEPFDHTHADQAFDEYKTADGLHRITVTYKDGKFAGLQLRAHYTEITDREPQGHQTYFDLNYTDIEEIQQLINAFHAAVAGIHKRKDPQ